MKDMYCETEGVPLSNLLHLFMQAKTAAALALVSLQWYFCSVSRCILLL